MGDLFANLCRTDLSWRIREINSVGMITFHSAAVCSICRPAQEKSRFGFEVRRGGHAHWLVVGEATGPVI